MNRISDINAWTIYHATIAGILYHPGQNKIHHDHIPALSAIIADQMLDERKKREAPCQSGAQ